MSIIADAVKLLRDEPDTPSADRLYAAAQCAETVSAAENVARAELARPRSDSRWSREEHARWEAWQHEAWFALSLAVGAQS